MNEIKVCNSVCVCVCVCVCVFELNCMTFGASFVSQMVKNLPAMQEAWIRSLGWEDPMEKEMDTLSSILIWRIPWTVACQTPLSMEFPSKNTRAGCHFLLQGNFPTQRLNQCLLLSR